MSTIYTLQARWPLTHGDHQQLRKARTGLAIELHKLAADGYQQVGPVTTEIREPHLVKTVKVVGPDNTSDDRLTPALWGLVAKPDYAPEDDQ